MPYANPADKLASRRRYYAKNKKKIIEYNTRWKRANPDKVRASARAYEATHVRVRDPRKRAIYSAKWRRLHPAKWKEVMLRHDLKRHYRLSVEAVDAMWQSQGRACAICREPAAYGKKGLHVDHDHHTLKVRGLLCGNCNFLVGKSYDSVAVLEAAIAYLKHHEGLA